MIESDKRIPPFGLRLPVELKERIQAAARESNRSMNAEIIARLEATLEEGEKIDELERQMDQYSSEVRDLRQVLDTLRATVQSMADANAAALRATGGE